MMVSLPSALENAAAYTDPWPNISDALDELLPVERVKFNDYAAEHRYLNNIGGGFIGRWSHDVVSYLVEPMDMLNFARLHHDRYRWAGPAGQDDHRRKAAAAHQRLRSGRAAAVPRANTTVSSWSWTSNLRGLLSAKLLPLHLQQPTLPTQSAASANDPEPTKRPGQIRRFQAEAEVPGPGGVGPVLALN